MRKYSSRNVVKNKIISLKERDLFLHFLEIVFVFVRGNELGKGAHKIFLDFDSSISHTIQKYIKILFALYFPKISFLGSEKGDSKSYVCTSTHIVPRSHYYKPHIHVFSNRDIPDKVSISREDLFSMSMETDGWIDTISHDSTFRRFIGELIHQELNELQLSTEERLYLGENPSQKVLLKFIQGKTPANRGSAYAPQKGDSFVARLLLYLALLNKSYSNSEARILQKRAALAVTTALTPDTPKYWILLEPKISLIKGETLQERYPELQYLFSLQIEHLRRIKNSGNPLKEFVLQRIQQHLILSQPDHAETFIAYIDANPHMLDAYLQSSVITKVPYILEGSSRMQMGFFLSETAIKNDFRMDDSRVICMGRVFQTAVDFFKGIRSTHPTDLSIRRNQLLQRMYSIETHEKKRVSDVFSVQMPPYGDGAPRKNFYFIEPNSIPLSLDFTPKDSPQKMVRYEGGDLTIRGDILYISKYSERLKYLLLVFAQDSDLFGDEQEIDIPFEKFIRTLQKKDLLADTSLQAFIGYGDQFFCITENALSIKGSSANHSKIIQNHFDSLPPEKIVALVEQNLLQVKFDLATNRSILVAHVSYLGSLLRGESA